MHKQIESTLRAFRHRNYRLFFVGQLISLIGTWVSTTATSWLIYRLEHSAVLLGLANFLSLFPSFVLAPFIGVHIDRWNRHRILLFTQIASMLQSAALAALTLSGVVSTTQILVLCLIQGLINAVDMPARHAFVPEMVNSPADLSNAIALNSALFNGARLIGPPIGGLIIAASSEGVCFLADTISYAAVIYSLLRMNLPKNERPAAHKAVLMEMAAGFRYAANYAPIRNALLLVALASLAGAPYAVLLPVFAHDVYRQGAAGLGLLMAAVGSGAFSSALYLASRTRVAGLHGNAAGGILILGSALLLFAANTSFYAALPLLFITGLGFLLITASCNTIIQTLVKPGMRGRVVSLYTMAFTGSMPLASLLGGAAAEYIGPQPTVAAGGMLCVLGGLFFLLRKKDYRQTERQLLAHSA